MVIPLCQDRYRSNLEQSDQPKEILVSSAVAPSRSGSRSSFAFLWRSRFGARLLREILIVGGLLVAYRQIRTIHKTDFNSAFANARDVVRLESWLGLPFEDDLQRILIDQTALIKLLNHYYIWFHFPVAVALLLWLFFRHPERYFGIRNLMAAVTFAALVIHLLFPLAPPRMMYGFVDTMRDFGPNIYSLNGVDGLANQIAAMPSLHFAWAMIEAIAVISVLNSRWRWIIIVHPLLMTLSIIVTANHWWIDAVAAAAIVIGASAVFGFVRRWVGDRRWSWTAFRFQSAEGIVRLETLANAPASHDSDGPSNLSTVANDDTGDRRSFVGNNFG